MAFRPRATVRSDDSIDSMKRPHVTRHDVHDGPHSEWIKMCSVTTAEVTKVASQMLKHSPGQGTAMHAASVAPTTCPLGPLAVAAAGRS